MIEESSDEIDDDSSYYLSSSDSDSSGGVDMLNFASSSDSDDRDSEDDRKMIVKKVKKVPKKRTKKGDRDRPPLLWEIWEEENARWIDEHEKDDVDLDGCGEMLPEAAEPSPDVLMPLLRFQKEWLAWALKQEASEMKGGILADEMGMGKTIQAISLVLSARSIERTETSGGASGGLPSVRTTLVVCPLVAMIQWMGEIAAHTEKGSVRVLAYHGAKRGKELAEKGFGGYDFVLTTYSTVEGEYRNYVMEPKVRCEWCQKLFRPNRLQMHLSYYCGPFASKTAKQAKQIKKSKVLSKGPVKKKVYNDRKKARDGSLKNSPLHSVKWERIILDEGHSIKDRRSNTARAIFALESTYRWALSGTPLQNRVGELYSLIRFLQVSPYSHYLCKDCDCMVLDVRSAGVLKCVNCTHSSVRHFCWWNRYVSKPIQSNGKVNEGKRAMILLKHKILKNIVLRRTKKGRSSDIALPPRIEILRRDVLDKSEKEFYEAMYTQGQTQLNTYVAAGTLLNNFAHIFDLLTRLRQAVNHPYLVVCRKDGSGNKGDDGAFNECCLCHDPAEDPVVSSCKHVFCKTCFTDYSAALEKVSCPSCSKPLTVDLTVKNNPLNWTGLLKGYKQKSILRQLDLKNFQTSTKIDALKEEIRCMVERDGSAKGIVFSQFTSFLDLINYSLTMGGVKCVQLVGSMTLAAREEAIKTFTDDPDCRIFLMSLKAGGVALNLTVASHVFLMDPWWNPAVERQAQDRIHRIGQYKPIRIIKFVIEGTIEERILRLQKKKELVFQGTVGGSTEALGKLTEQDLRFLFYN
ncbi:hypothetical protein QJS04_geneDACA023447 [Acorus gramineus]|uniref:DNA repair protein RAD16 n=1 Tax=Acorus gramineus TaxID=55184 RepID=A0AAV9AA35_ACOGR|nr:hypothetical protein QJS04_geneDACA023447 [Acorus gramineus]